VKRLVIYFFLIYLFAWKIVGWGNLANAATLTTQAKNILTTELHNHNITDQFKINEVVCLAENIYFEARAESEVGKAAVGNTTKNRVLHTNWPNTYCEVVKQGPVRESWKTRGKDVKDEDRVYWPIKHRCQFSWYCDGKKDVIWANYEKTGQTIEGNARAWRDSVELAIYITGFGKLTIDDNTHGALYYYNHNLVYPHWADAMILIGVEGNHTFMKEPI
jgi:spore germination cell wall hydrolase CwlJ-like protein|tara:strand:- start:330 stop:986 length:657 start_codon:yes stop_codon:yes gene_type:complete